MAMLEVKNLGISFGGLRAVDGLDMTIEKGELYGLIGPNGAGKTTAFNMLTGVYKPTDGVIKLDGEKKMDEKAMELLKVFNLQDEWDYKASNLPYGKQRKLEIARALATEPKLLLLDEPAAGMNPNETGELMDTIQFVCKNFDMTVLLIEHDMKLVSGICQKLTVLNFGQVLAQGKTSDVLNDPKVIKAYLGE